jgi:hypothetical protein
MGRGCYQFVGKLDGKRPLGRRWHRRGIDINMDLQAMGWGGMDWMGLNQDKSGWQGVVKVVMNLLVPNIVGNFVTS